MILLIFLFLRDRSLDNVKPISLPVGAPTWLSVIVAKYLVFNYSYFALIFYISVLPK